MFDAPSNPIRPLPRTPYSEPVVPPPDDAVLLARVQQGDDQALSDVFRRYSGAVYSIALRVLHDSGRAEDIVQEVFLQLWRSPGAFVAGIAMAQAPGYDANNAGDVPYATQRNRAVGADIMVRAPGTSLIMRRWVSIGMALSSVHSI